MHENLRGAEKTFILVSCLDLALGMLQMCNIVLKGTRYVLWGILFVNILIYILNEWKIQKNHLDRMNIMGWSLIGLGILMYIFGKVNIVIRFAFFFLNMRYIDKKKYLKYTLVTMSTMLCIIIISSFVSKKFPLYVLDKRPTERGWNGIRWMFGFCSPNMLQFVVMHIFMYFVVLKKEKLRIMQYILLLCSQAFFFIWTDSKTGFYLAILFTGIIIIMKCFPKWKWEDMIWKCYIVSMVMMSGISLLASIPIKNNLMIQLDSFISGRMEQLHTHPLNQEYASPFIENWHLFPNILNRDGYDMGYVQMFYYFGIIPALVFLAFVLYSMWCAWKQKDAIVMLVIWTMCLYLFMESRYFSNYIARDFILAISSIVLWNYYEETRKNVMKYKRDRT